MRWITTQWCLHCGNNVGQDEAMLGGIVCPKCGNDRNYVQIPTAVIGEHGLWRTVKEFRYRIDNDMVSEPELKSRLIQTDKGVHA